MATSAFREMCRRFTTEEPGAPTPGALRAAARAEHQADALALVVTQALARADLNEAEVRVRVLQGLRAPVLRAPASDFSRLGAF